MAGYIIVLFTLPSTALLVRRDRIEGIDVIYSNISVTLFFSVWYFNISASAFVLKLYLSLTWFGFYQSFYLVYI